VRRYLLAPGGSVEPLQLLDMLAAGGERGLPAQGGADGPGAEAGPRGAPGAAAVAAGLLQALAGGFAPRPDAYLEQLVRDKGAA
jgi:hypothetical protein